MKANNSKKVIIIILVGVCAIAVAAVAFTHAQNSNYIATAESTTEETVSSVAFSVSQKTGQSIVYDETLTPADDEPTANQKITAIGSTAVTQKNGTSITKKATTTKPSSTKPTTTKTPATTTKSTTTKKVTPTTKLTTKPSTTAPSKTLYYYTDGTTGYTPKPGAKYWDGYGWDFVPGDVSAEDIKEAHKNDSTEPWY